MKSGYVLGLDVHVGVLVAFEVFKPRLNCSQGLSLVQRLIIFRPEVLPVYDALEGLGVVNPLQTSQSISDGHDVKCL